MDRHSSSTACSSSSSPSSSIIRTYQSMDHQWQVYYNYVDVAGSRWLASWLLISSSPSLLFIRRRHASSLAVSCPFHALIRLNASAF
ncbi:hypothetical protein NEUTE1DRAFT_42325 [Neurospora tetrasperma FGSC 2508]|uniref:Uncharacterized protein n=1 Tax=Neurospora tetrasperma (strain FGSC 2508 / ATCC MYA-4615 / P0657) TaxID=510951 RepID=F8MM80_NEUT8|nr:uncharacterized protein NEUTE1DRAFT_42325 [Neurospora tetrasperma FGSC 2508]EGO57754.1 hypothetical protein NEUTE1DRAFT_42325 [Neurospora tetrasperma FGSC 2508]EGZ71974.1 hypothetical protein NEUTE2DRAFT_129347 [Neurospora tetrasperma FGSC 2509]